MRRTTACSNMKSTSERFCCSVAEEEEEDRSNVPGVVGERMGEEWEGLLEGVLAPL